LTAEPEAEDSGVHEAQDEPLEPGEDLDQPLVGRVSPLWRYLFFLVWMFAVPAALAVAAVRLIKPKGFAIDAGVIRTFVGEQQVPATILFFTFFAMVLWKLRHRLPLSGATGILGRTDLPARLRSKYDDAAHLIEETRRIMKARDSEVSRALGRTERDKLNKAVDKLETAMLAAKFREDRFLRARETLDELVTKHLRRWRKSEAREYAESIGVAVAVALVLRFFVIEAFKIPSGSMIPTLAIGDHIFVAKYAYGPLLPRSDTRLYERLPPARGDVMVFKFPENKDQDFIKRVIALPGDTLEVVSGRPVINGWLVPSCYVGRIQMSYGAMGHLYLEYMADKSFLTMHDEKLRTTSCKQDKDCGLGRVCRSGFCGMLQGPYTVQPNEVWVMGDNRNNSHDSRSWKGGLGAGVPFQNIKGRAMFVWWSWDPRGGLSWDRLFVNVLGSPKLPTGAPSQLLGGLQKCLTNRPPDSKTTPPKPKP